MNHDELFDRLREEGSALISLPETGTGTGTGVRQGLFSHPTRVVMARNISEVKPAFGALEEWTGRGGYAAGFVCYEAAAAFDSCMETFLAEGFPLLGFSFYEQPPEEVELPHCNDDARVTKSIPEWSESEYRERIAAVRAELFAGNIYQANLTFRCRAPLSVEPETLFVNLVSRHPVPFAAWLNFHDFKVLSLSPELFLESDGSRVSSSPMKGTARRHPVAERDRAAAAALAADPKNMAENLMITDMVRNDLGRVCRAGSVVVDPLFHVDTYATVHQMISTVHGELRAGTGLFELFRATFPPASITGAPKVRAMSVIRANESSPRRIYTGTVGCFFPGGICRLNVAIRTLVCSGGTVETGIGGGITYDSDAGDEWREALLKSRYATEMFPEFELFETMRWTKREGFVLLAEHIRRAEESQAYFGRPVRAGEIGRALERLLPKLEAYPSGACVKFLLGRDGGVRTELSPPRLPNWNGLPLRVLISDDRTEPENVFLYHKTTNRNFYDSRFHAARQAGFHEVLFCNTRGEVTEGAISNLFLRKGGRWFTPALECGLLPGLRRAERMRELQAEEASLTLADLTSADEVIVGNSLRGDGSVAELVTETGKTFRPVTG